MPFGELGRTLGRDGGEAGQLARSVTMRATDAVGFVERKRLLERLMALGARRRSMLTADLEQAHREPQHGSGHAVAMDRLDAGVTAVAPRQLDRVGVRPSPRDRIVELLYQHAVK